MGAVSIVNKTKKVPFEILHINRTKREINATVIIFSFIDKDTKQYVAFVPSLQVSAYGSTKKKCQDMLKEAFNESFMFLISLKPDQFNRELKKLGWIHSKIKTKEYSKSFVDIDGNLHNFNAENDKIQVELMAV